MYSHTGVQSQTVLETITTPQEAIVTPTMAIKGMSQETTVITITAGAIITMTK
jgi:hypothetical protein